MRLVLVSKEECMTNISTAEISNWAPRISRKQSLSSEVSQGREEHFINKRKKNQREVLEPLQDTMG